MEPLVYCRERVAKPGSTLHYALLFAQPPVHDDLLALSAFAHEATRIPDSVSDPALARTKLAWWGEEVGQLFQASPRHPVTRALVPAAARGALERGLMDEVLAGVGMDLDYGTYPSFREVTIYCHRLGGSLAALAVRICGAEEDAALRFAHDLGIAATLTAQLQQLRPNLRAGRLYVPEDELTAHSLQRADLLADQPPPAVTTLLQAQAARATDFFTSAWQRLEATQRGPLVPITVHGALRARLLTALQRAGQGVLQRHYRLTPLRKLLLAQRTARRERHLARKASQ